MPYCEACTRYWTPPSMNPDGSCPTCGARVAAVVSTGSAAALKRGEPLGRPSDGDAIDAGAPEGDAAEAGDPERTPVPWHFALLLVAVVLYLGFRAYEGVAWVIARLF